MMKKIICLVLALLMVLPAMVACSGGGDAVDNINKEAERYTTTLNMWLVTESPAVVLAGELLFAGLTPTTKASNMTEEEKAKIASLTEEERLTWEQVYQISQKINSLTKGKFNTKLNLRYVLEENYYDKVEAAFDEHAKVIAAEKEAQKADKEANKNGTNKKDEEKSSEDERVYNEYGVPDIKYPDAKDSQVDILFVGSFEKYTQYADKEWLIPLDSQLAETSNKLAYYLSSTLLESARYQGGIYAIPNNSCFGEYTYLLVNEKLATDLGAGEFTSIYDPECEAFLDLVLNMKEDVYPIYSESGKVDLSLVHYWNYDIQQWSYGEESGVSYILRPEEFSLFGGVYSNSAVHGTLVSYDLLSNSTPYLNMLKKKIKYDYTEGYITTNPEDTAAVRIETGLWQDRLEYEEDGYKVLVMETPRATNETVFSSMFGVGGLCSEPERAGEIIAYLNTNAEFRNLLQYGIEGVNYTLHSKDGYPYVTPTKENLYKMDIAKTGNMFLAYPDKAEDVLAWEYAKEQNREAVAYPTLGMYFALNEYKIDEKSVRVIQAVSEKIAPEYEKLLANELVTADDIDQFFSDISTPETLLEKAGGEVKYTMNGKEETVTLKDLTDALTLFAGNRKPEDNKNVLRSPKDLYTYWREISGLKAQIDAAASQK